MDEVPKLSWENYVETIRSVFEDKTASKLALAAGVHPSGEMLRQVVEAEGRAVQGAQGDGTLAVGWRASNKVANGSFIGKTASSQQVNPARIPGHTHGDYSPRFFLTTVRADRELIGSLGWVITCELSPLTSCGPSAVAARPREFFEDPVRVRQHSVATCGPRSIAAQGV